MSDRLSGKVAIVSGGARGMGAAHVRSLASAGARVMVFDVIEGEMPALAVEFGDEQVSFRQADVTSAEDWRAVVTSCQDRFGSVDALVNNAGICLVHALETVSESDFRRTVDVNQVGTFLGMQAVVPAMRAAGGGSIVNIASTAGCVGFADLFAYVATKWAIRGMTRAAALELAQDRIRVNALCPGDTDTPMIHQVAETPSGAVPSADDLPWQRWARPEEVSAAVVFLASDESSYMSGSDVVVDAAYTAE